ncbi:DMT family transporter [Limisalsivibrio acetivorans]|uniref:DMT family transporter n=1 Tax=Limisalsivibrio acetivorans TaxID=1304888 RepID=UPI0003B38400|nr:DMT family transporter [Limisalsivibrio acetivorans]
MINNNLAGKLLVISAAVLWGTTGTTQALSPEGASPLAVGALRLAIGGTALFLIYISKNGFSACKKWLNSVTLSGALFIALYQICFFSGVYMTGVAVGTIVAIGSSPMFAGLLGSLVMREGLSKAWYVSSALAVAGGTVLVLTGSKEGVSINIYGILLALGAGASYALYTLTSKLLLERKLKPSEVMASQFFFGAFMLAPFLFINDISWTVTVQGALLMAHLGLIVTTLSYVLFARGLQYVKVSTAGTLALAEPLTAGCLGIFFLGEAVSPGTVTGIGLLIAGLVVLSVNRT